MEDEDIVKLYLERNPNAIEETDKKYNKYCKKIALNILNNNEDAEECVNDAYLKTWDSIPPQHPKLLSAYIGKIVRNLSIDRIKYKKASKRGSGEMALILDELSECISGKENIEDELYDKEIIEAINNFIDTLPKNKRDMFILRYWYAYTTKEIAKKLNISEGTICVTISRTREKLKEYLTIRGYNI